MEQIIKVILKRTNRIIIFAIVDRSTFLPPNIQREREKEEEREERGRQKVNDTVKVRARARSISRKIDITDSSARWLCDNADNLFPAAPRATSSRHWRRSNVTPRAVSRPNKRGTPLFAPRARASLRRNAIRR